ncbi:acyl-CoA thioesterase [Flavobacteriaceae bacterium R38]|nr:acyl-CoA thioesterase [Flavobacteriaceae bacterium R38]
MKIYTKEIVVKESDLDEMQHVNNVQYLYWVQDAAKEHWQKLASKTLQETYLWVVLNHNITYKNAAILNDKLIIKTYVKESSGVTSARIVEMYEADSQKLIVNTETKWCLLNAKTKKPVRIPEEIIHLFHN